MKRRSNIEKVNKSSFVGKVHSDIKKDYRMLKVLGKGAFSKVYQAQHRKSKLLRCIKKIDKLNFTVNQNESIMNEIKILTEVNHPNLLKIIEYYEKDDSLYIVTEYLKGGELFDYITKKEFFTEKNAMKIIKQMLKAISYMHNLNIIHRDLKPENIVFSTDQDSEEEIINVKIIDFGTSRKVKREEILYSIMGTLYYIAPEVLRQSYGLECDIWSCGIILYILLCGYPPFNGDEDEDVIKNISLGKVVFLEDDWKNISDDAKDLISKMLILNPKERFTAKECLEHRWFSKNNKNKKDLKKYGLFKYLKDFKIKTKFQKAILLYYVNFFDNNSDNELAESFLELDKKGDGKLTESELLVNFQSIESKEGKKIVKDIMDKFDFDKNNTIGYDEFLVANFNFKKFLNERKIEKIFNLIDIDGNGFITEDELKTFFRISNNDEDIFIKNLIKEVDLDDDGQISGDEFKILMNQFLN